jgi:hypothetical protein
MADGLRLAGFCKHPHASLTTRENWRDSMTLGGRWGMADYQWQQGDKSGTYACTQTPWGCRPR